MPELNYLLRPRSIAIVGVTDKAGTYGCRAATNIVNCSIGEHVYYVNPKRDELFGRKCYHSVGEIPEHIDCVVLCVPKTAVCACIEQAGEAGVKAAVVYASGFSEEQSPEGTALEEQLKEIAERYDMAIVGPNTAGLINKVDNISLFVGPAKFKEKPVKQGIAIVGQSGFIVGNLNEVMSEYLSFAVGSGNGSITHLEDYVHYFLDDPAVNAIGIYLEGLKDVPAFIRALDKAHRLGKPVVILKSGQSVRGAKAAASHTGNLAGSYASFAAVFEKFGVVSVNNLEEFVSTCKIFSLAGERLPHTPKIAAINFSGGENTLCADICERVGLEFAAYRESTLADMQACLPEFANASNPLDATTGLFSDREKVKELLRAIAKDPEVGLIVFGSEFGLLKQAKDLTIVDVLEELYREGFDLPAVVIPSCENARYTELVSRLESLGAPFLSTGEIGYRSVYNVCKYVQQRGKTVQPELSLHSGKKGVAKKALSEYDSKIKMKEAGVKVPGQLLAADEAELEKALDSMSFPLALKISSPDILHKTEAGGVRLNITDRDGARSAFAGILESCRAYMPEARIDGVMVQEMAKPGLEMIVGVSDDAQFGQMLLVGLGGISVELFKDVVLLPCPVTKEEALQALAKLKSVKLLTGFRGSAAKDTDALAELMVRVSRYAADNREKLAELDLNPVFVYDKGEGCCAVDALVAEYTE